MDVTGEQEKAARTYEETVANYPRSFAAYDNLGLVYGALGLYEKAIDMNRQSQHITTTVGNYSDLANYLLAVQRFDEARKTTQEAQARKLGSYIHNALYALAFLAADSSGMAGQQEWFASKPEVEHRGLTQASDTEAYAGRLGKAREFTRKAVDAAIRADSKGNAGIWWENAALREAAFGNPAETRQAAASGLKFSPDSQAVQVEAALAYAMAGDSAKAEALARDLNKLHPLDTQTQSLWLPAIQAQLDLNRKDPAAALNRLQVAHPPIEYAAIPFLINGTGLYTAYLRGQANLAAGQGAAAAAEFQKILDHSGIVWNCWTGALARLGLARAYALQAKNANGADSDAARVRALAAYKDFLALWKDADPEIPIYRQAKAEYANFQ
jgi:eukaryotic-like serine/threonine-protein kinase